MKRFQVRFFSSFAAFLIFFLAPSYLAAFEERREPVSVDPANFFHKAVNAIGHTSIYCNGKSTEAGGASAFLVDVAGAPHLITAAHSAYGDKLCYENGINYIDFNPSLTFDPRVTEAQKLAHIRIKGDALNYEAIKKYFFANGFRKASGRTLNAYALDFAIFKLPRGALSSLQRSGLKVEPLKLAKNWKAKNRGVVSIGSDRSFASNFFEYIQTGCSVSRASHVGQRRSGYRSTLESTCFYDDGRSGGAMLALSKDLDLYVIGVTVGGQYPAVTTSPIQILAPTENLILEFREIYGDENIDAEEPEFFNRSSIKELLSKCADPTPDDRCSEELMNASFMERFQSSRPSETASELLKRAMMQGNPDALFEFGIMYETRDDASLEVHYRPLEKETWVAKEYPGLSDEIPLSTAEELYEGFDTKLMTRTYFSRLLGMRETLDVSHNPRTAAKFFYDALAAGNCSLLWRKFDAWEPDVAKELQQLLKAYSLYGGVIDGLMGRKSYLGMRELSGCAT